MIGKKRQPERVTLEMFYAEFREFRSDMLEFKNNVLGFKDDAQSL